MKRHNSLFVRVLQVAISRVTSRCSWQWISFGGWSGLKEQFGLEMKCSNKTKVGREPEEAKEGAKYSARHGQPGIVLLNDSEGDIHSQEAPGIT